MMKINVTNRFVKFSDRSTLAHSVAEQKNAEYGTHKNAKLGYHLREIGRED